MLLVRTAIRPSKKLYYGEQAVIVMPELAPADFTRQTRQLPGRHGLMLVTCNMMQVGFKWRLNQITEDRCGGSLFQLWCRTGEGMSDEY